MAKVGSPIQFSTYFKIDPKMLLRAGVFDPILNVDTKLFIDPLLLEGSSQTEIASSRTSFTNYFGDLIRLLVASTEIGDLPWRTAYKRFLFRELKGTCLGYGAGSISGHAIGPKLANKLIRTAKQIVDLGVRDPDLFIVLPLLEEEVGPDLISDMTTRIILPNLAEFNNRIAEFLKLETEEFTIDGNKYKFVLNPLESKRTPVILVPLDVLRDLPVANDWDEVCDAAAQNEVLRREVNQLIGDIWKVKTRKDKDAIRGTALDSKKSFEKLLEIIHGAKAKPYETEQDPDGLLVWVRIHETVAAEYPLAIEEPKKQSVDEIYKVVKQILEQFRFLVEKKGLAKEFWYEGKRRNEKSVQRMFFAIADSYCKANNIDITPEADTGTGAIDFKFSSGYQARVLLEVKLSDNNKMLQGYERQLETYKEAEQAYKAIYLVIDVGGMGDKDDKLIELKNARVKDKLPASDIEFIDGTLKPSASKR